MARAALADVREMLAGASARRVEAIAACEVCSKLESSHYCLSTAVSPESLPGLAYQLIPERLLGTSRCLEVVRCRCCETPWRYRRDYEYLVGGTEDEEFLDRLDGGGLIAEIATAIDRIADGSGPRRLEETLGLLRRAGEVEDLTPEAATRRAALREAIVALDEPERRSPASVREVATELLDAANVGPPCAICRLLPPTVDPIEGVALYITPNTTPFSPTRSCPRCGTAYLHDFGGADGPRLVRLDVDGFVAEVELLGTDPLHDHLDGVQLDGGARSPSTPPLHFFVHNQREDAIRALLEAGADPDDPDEFAWTPLMRASESDSVDLVGLLLGGGATIDARNAVGETALFLAAEAGSRDAVEVLIAAGADPTIPCGGPNERSQELGIRGVADAGTTPEARASALGHSAVADLLAVAGLLVS